ncbi:MAG: hypothetical protein JST01_19905 [Cyanobacteria bacterium SZAS TMP-1]|nr:hypothetical protein [Cyanobacteria bacterium SZAS TMP-1]
MQPLQRRPWTQENRATGKKQKKLLLMDKTVLTCTFLACATAIGISMKPHPTEKMGLEQIHQGKFNQAAITLEEAIKKNGPTCEAYLGLARAYNHMMRYEQGLASADKALQYHQIEPNAWAEHAVANFGLGNYQAALSDAEQALSLDSSNYRAMHVQEKAQSVLAENKPAQ